jgi:hypothetical protein
MGRRINDLCAEVPQVTISKKNTAYAVKGKSGATSKKPPVKSHDHVEKEAVVAVNRRESRDRRLGSDRRSHQTPVAVDRRTTQRREKVNRRRQIDPTTCERDYTNDEIEFMSAMDNYKRHSGRMFPTCSEVLEVLRSLGYQKCPPQVEVELPAVSANVPSAAPALNLPTIHSSVPTIIG